MNKGKIVQVIGPVVDVEFPDKLPRIFNALTVEYPLGGQKNKLTLEVQSHMGDHWIRSVAMSSRVPPVVIRRGSSRWARRAL